MRKTAYSLTIIFLFSCLFHFKAFAVQTNDILFGAGLPIPDHISYSVTEDAIIAHGAGAVRVLMAGPEPPVAAIDPVPVPAYLINPATVGARFQVTYIPAGQRDPWGANCTSIPSEARASIHRATTILGNIIQSSVPITINVCWAQLPPGALGYSGGADFLINFNNAPLRNVWYQSALANSLAGRRLSSNADMHIAMSSDFNWYFGLDANPPSGVYDFVTVMIHEIIHGLNFTGGMRTGTNVARYGSQINNTGSFLPTIYDTFMRDGSGRQLTNTSVYPNPPGGSHELFTAVTSNDLWWHGPNAMSANNNQRVRMYAPASWSSGSSYSHLDTATFGNTPNRLMVHRYVSAIHDPGPITRGILRDMGWRMGGGPTPPGGCPAQSLRWLNCGAHAAAGANNVIRRLNNTLPNFTGVGVFRCTNGRWTPVPNAGSFCRAVGGGQARWVVRSQACCHYGPLAFAAAIDGVTRQVVVPGCSSPSQNQGFAATRAGNKTVAMRILSPACGVNLAGRGTLNMINNACYSLTLHYRASERRFIVFPQRIACPGSSSGTADLVQSLTPIDCRGLTSDSITFMPFSGFKDQHGSEQ